MDKELIEDLLIGWDERHTDFLKSIYGRNLHNPLFINKVVEVFFNNSRLEHSTTWLIKHYIDDKNILTKEQIEVVLRRFGQLTFWGSQLHILQIIPKLQLSKRLLAQIEPTIRKHLKSENKFVKASAYEAYYEVVKQFPDLKNEFIIMCNDVLEEESASVKVKIRRVLNKA